MAISEKAKGDWAESQHLPRPDETNPTGLCSMTEVGRDNSSVNVTKFRRWAGSPACLAMSSQGRCLDFYEVPGDIWNKNRQEAQYLSLWLLPGTQGTTKEGKDHTKGLSSTQGGGWGGAVTELAAITRRSPLPSSEGVTSRPGDKESQRHESPVAFITVMITSTSPPNQTQWALEPDRPCPCVQITAFPLNVGLEFNFCRPQSLLCQVEFGFRRPLQDSHQRTRQESRTASDTWPSDHYFSMNE